MPLELAQRLPVALEQRVAFLSHTGGKATHPPRLRAVSTVAPFGSWGSPIDAGGGRAGGRAAGRAGAGGRRCGLVGRGPAGGGRARGADAAARGRRAEEVTPPGANVRTRVHEYGGGAWHLAGPDLVLFVDFADQRLYRLRLGEEPVAITPGAGERRRRCATPTSTSPPTAGPSSACARSTARAKPRTRSSRCRSTAAPSRPCSPPAATSTPSRGSAPTAATLAFTCWDHPNMPWDGTELWVAPLADPGAARASSPAAPRESIFQPEWDGEGRLHFVSDRDGWWNLYRAERRRRLEQLTAERADLGHPQWLFGGATYALLADGVDRLRALRERRSNGSALLDRRRRRGARPRPALHLVRLALALAARGGEVAFAASSPDDARPRSSSSTPPAASWRRSRAAARSRSTRPTSRPRGRSSSRPASGAVAHAFYYPPANAEFDGPAGRAAAADRPEPRRPDLARDPGARPRVPLLDQPRLRRRRRQLPRLQRLRPRLPRRPARHLGHRRHRGLHRRRPLPRRDAARSTAARLAIRGGSAGGYTTLCALVFHDDFAAGASYYGVADAETLARDTHKFESRYLDGLIGPYPERADLYRERSPIHFVERLRSPVILFQGLEDEIVPPNQAETMVGGAGAPTASPTPTSPSRASSTASAAPRPRSAASKPSSTSTAGSSASSPPTSSSRSRSTACPPLSGRRRG